MQPIAQLDTDRQKGKIEIKGEKHVYHCNFFNVFWQRTIERTKAVEGKRIIREAVRDHVSSTLKDIYADHGIEDAEERASIAEDYFRNVAAMGQPDIPAWFGDQPEIAVENSHFANTWLELFGEQEEPKCTYWEGALTAAVAAITGEDCESVQVNEAFCRAQGDEECRFEVNFR